MGFSQAVARMARINIEMYFFIVVWFLDALRAEI
jgi:hypothetical protein